MTLEGNDLALMNAVYEGEHDDMKQALLAGADIGAFNGEHTPLSSAIRHGPDYDAMRILLDAGASPDVNLESDDGCDDGQPGLTPLMMALSYPSAFAVILSHTRCGIDFGRQTYKGRAMVDVIPERTRSEIYALLSLYYGDEKQTAELRAIADAAGSFKKAKPARNETAKRANSGSLSKQRPPRYRLPTGETWHGLGMKPAAFRQWQEDNPDQPFPTYEVA